MSLTKQVSLHGRRAYLTKDDVLVGRGGVASGGEGKPSIYYPSHDRVAFVDDFLGQGIHADTGSQGLWGKLRSADTGADGSIDIVSGHSNGVLRLRTHNNLGTAAASSGNIASIVLGRHFTANQNIRMSARIRVGVPAEDSTLGKHIVYVGFTDDTGTLEIPMFVDTGEAATGDTGSTPGASVGELRAVATDMVGFLFDGKVADTGSGWTPARWHGVSATAAGLTANQFTRHTDTGATAIAANPGIWQWLEVEVDRNAGDTGGVARFWIDGKYIGRIDSPVGLSAKLTPVVCVAPHGPADTGSTAVDIDVIAVSASRDTGD